MCRAQYPGEVSSSSVAKTPVTFDTTGIRGARNVSPRATSSNSCNTPSMWNEWKA
ncbi:hypothetical protein GCM10010340_48750 [Streptomyces griseoloalbus]|nr:hypothetical protein GCM10010340_48750 [Streptomyces albaduncus]